MAKSSNDGCQSRNNARKVRTLTVVDTKQGVLVTRNSSVGDPHLSNNGRPMPVRGVPTTLYSFTVYAHIMNAEKKTI